MYKYKQSAFRQISKPIKNNTVYSMYCSEVTKHCRIEIKTYATKDLKDAYLSSFIHTLSSMPSNQILEFDLMPRCRKAMLNENVHVQS